MILETNRLMLRELVQSDLSALCSILKDDEVMYAYEGAFEDEQVQEWLDKQLRNYRRYGFGLWAVVHKETGGMIGQCGITMQDCKGKQVMEVGYLFQKAYWHCGFAAEAAAACKEYAFTVLGADAVYSIIRDTNLPSQRVARRNGMYRVGALTKNYRGVAMPHFIYRIKRGENHEC